ncbi:MAG TPA: 50S ribosomal protein L29 [candidate division WOR-3 bacterium]|uniref:Large ribosomal subunit protein uL29 n=1 Tax=candidate division WOR-3 bacterium TaxID=2052148 RepID=A0A7C5M4F8_UNCW3|nr:50S ribosomal protein L29 [Candidatus Hydrothermae bacterium]RKY99087.1 MAG: 50S ribosomal protein L29 [Candidatus Hydrothermae bacterium]HHF58112.1 50S ribosomal protein L29 [candidate division WOR-3 bacterium]
MKAKELRELTDEELKQRIKDLKEELFTLRMEKAMHRLAQPHRFKEIKREIARILTILNERRKVS